jgi:L-asparaginase/Glu-tRNA(Gln) amidotransferase subunit D
MNAKLLPLGPIIINGGGTINSAPNRRGSLCPEKSTHPDHVDSPVLCDSSQILFPELLTIINVISRHLEKRNTVIFMMGTDTVGNVGDALKDHLPACNTMGKTIVLAAAMTPDHKDAVLDVCKKVSEPGITVVVSGLDGTLYSWHLDAISIRKTGRNLNLPFEVFKSPALDNIKGSMLIASQKDQTLPLYLNHPSLLHVHPTITHNVDEITAMIHDAGRAATETTSSIVLVGYGLFNFPSHPKILDAIKAVQGKCPVTVSTQTEAYFVNGIGTHTLYGPLQTLMDLGVSPLYAKNFPK